MPTDRMRVGANAVIVVPCFNEARRLDGDALLGLAAECNSVRILFVNDGSTDATQARLEELQNQSPETISVLCLEQNVGKGPALFQGIRASLEDPTIELIAILDADLSTPAIEILRLIGTLRKDADVDVVIGSRVRRLGARITRSPFRHFTGRLFAAAASSALGTSIYDTQCGAKAFRRTPTLEAALQKPVPYRWSFDVELLSRLAPVGAPGAWDRIREVPLREWQDHGESHVTLASGAKAFAELAAIARSRRSGR